jgi:hypothetical protein
MLGATGEEHTHLSVRRPPPALRRAQALVIAALSMFLLTVMVMMTLAIGSRVREKLELDNLAEAAAYNDAVMIARTFNAVSMLNRTQVSHLVAMAGVQSLISWAGMYRGALKATHDALEEAKEPYNDECDDKGMRCGCASKMEIEGLEQIVLDEEERVAMLWDPLDRAAGNQSYEIQLEALRIFDDELSLYEGQLLDELADQRRTRSLVSEAKAGQRYPDELSAPTSAAGVVLREVAMEDGCAGGALGCAPFAQNAHAVWATMGTRGYQFVTARNNTDILNKIMSLMPAGVSVTGMVRGSGFFSDENSHGEASKENQQAWAHDHLSLKVVYGRGTGKCTKTSIGNSGATAWVKSAKRVGDEQHAWSGGNDQDPVPRHTVGGGMWPSFIDYSTVKLTMPEDNYGQPKAYAVVQRDYATRGVPPPWEQRFALRFSSQGAALDLRARALSTALGTGVAYYHRGAHWKEPPNFFNPFWRATLMAADVDLQAQDDVPATLVAAGNPSGARAFTQLQQAGFRGF